MTVLHLPLRGLVDLIIVEAKHARYAWTSEIDVEHADLEALVC